MKNKTLDIQIVLAGRGGQGVLFLTRLIDELAVSLHQNVISSETHGMAMRGGSVSSYIRIGGYAAPLISSEEADIMLCLAETELAFNMHLLKKDCFQLYVNSCHTRPHAIDAELLADRAGSRKAANLALLGYAAAHDAFPFSYRDIVKTLKTISPSKEALVNLRALEAGFQAKDNT